MGRAPFLMGKMTGRERLSGVSKQHLQVKELRKESGATWAQDPSLSSGFKELGSQRPQEKGAIQTGSNHMHVSRLKRLM